MSSVPREMVLVALVVTLATNIAANEDFMEKHYHYRVTANTRWLDAVVGH